MRISAVVVNYNSGSHLSDCIRGLLQYLNLQDGGDEIVIVDNQSTDESLAIIESFSGPKIVRPHTNVGYGGGCNIGSEHTSGDIILFMNPDATLISPVESIRSVFKKDANCVLVAPRILRQGRIYDTVRPLPTVISDLLGELGIDKCVIDRARLSCVIRGREEPVYFTGFSSGCAIFVRREAFERVGRFDADFFLYYEEADLCKRLTNFGYKFVYDNRCIVKHDSGGSSGSLKWRMTAIRYNSKLRYFSKHVSKAGLIFHMMLNILILFLKFGLFLLGMAARRIQQDKYHAFLYAIRLYIEGYTPWRLSEFAVTDGQIDLKSYWEDRLQQNWGLHGVGCIGYGGYYNKWMYKVRESVFNYHIKKLDLLSSKKLKVLDIGSGTGFYLGLWQSNGVEEVMGSDITKIAVEQLKKAYPTFPIVQLDIGSSLEKQNFLNRKFDVITALDVLFHIVDDNNFHKAFFNISRMLTPGGYFIFSDIFPKNKTIKNMHQFSRSIQEISSLLKKAGFRIVKRTPMFILMNTPADTKGNWPLILWRLLMFPQRIFNFLGFFYGAILFPLEKLLIRVLKESPSTELMICQKE